MEAWVWVSARSRIFLLNALRQPDFLGGIPRRAECFGRPFREVLKGGLVNTHEPR